MKLASRPLSLALIASLLAGPVSAQDLVDGFGRDIPLSFAVEQIVPPRYSVSYGPGVDAQRRVSWKGGADWNVVLNDMLSEHGFSSDVSETEKLRITANPAARAPMSSGLNLADYKRPSLGPRPGSYADDLRGQRSGLTIAGMEATKAETAPAPTPAPAPAAVAAKAVPAADKVLAVAPYVPPAEIAATDISPNGVVIGVEKNEVKQVQEVWLVYANTTLEDTLMDWADRAGWTVLWNSDYSYDIQANAQFEGDFISAASLLIKSIAMNPESDMPPKGKFYEGNNVLVITTRTEGRG